MICDIVQIFSGFILQIILYICLFRIIWITLRRFYCEIQSTRKVTKRLGQTELLADPNDYIPQLFDDSGNAEDVIFNEEALNQDDEWDDDDEEAWEGEEEDDVQPLNQTYDKNDSKGGRGRLNQTFEANDLKVGRGRLNQTFNANDSSGGRGRLNQTFDANDSRLGDRLLNQTFDAEDSNGGERMNQTFDANDSRGGGRHLNQTFDADDSKRDGGLDRNIGIEDEKILDDLTNEEDSSDVDANTTQTDYKKTDEEIIPFPPKKTWRVYQNYNQILKDCLEKKILFEDPEFPANVDSITHSKEKYNETNIIKNMKWSRPPEVTKEPKFFIEGSPTRFNMIGGEYGKNMGLLSGVACMTLYPELIFKVAPPDQSFTKKYAGIFRFKFWHFGDWIEIVVDDRLPYYNDKAIFAHSKDGKEFWFSLLEKAYAKLHGTYEATENTQASEVLVDLTGGIAELYEVRDYRDDDLFNILTRSNEMQSLISTKAIKYSDDPDIVGKHPNQEGIYPGLVYSVTNVAKILVNKREDNEEYSFVELMIRLRNPWGQGTEWNGRWHDKGREWKWVSQEDKSRLGIQHLQDGEFWMSFTDYIIRFRSIEIVSLTPSSVEHSQKIPWEWTFMHGEWVPGVSAGGLLYIHKNPQYRITLTAVDELKGDGKCVACISLMQKYRRAMQKLGKTEVSLGFEIYHLKRNYLQIIPVPEEFFLEANHPLVHCPATETREVTLTVRLPPGTYLIIPFTEKFSTEAEFLIRVCASSFVKLSANDRLLRLKAKRDVLVYDELFEMHAEKFDEYDEEEIGWKNIKKIMDYFGSSIPHFKGFSKETVRSAVALTDANSNGRIDKVEYETLCGLLKYYKGFFVKFDKKNTGHLPPFTIGIVFDHLGFEINNSILNTIVHRYAREDGSFSFDDYILCVLKITALCMKFKSKASKRSNVAKFGIDDWLEATIFT